MIRHQIRTGRTVLRRIHGSVATGKGISSISPVEEIMRLLDQLPRVNGRGHYVFDLAAQLTADDIGEVVRQLKDTNPGMVGVIKELGYWFPKDAKHHVRQAFVCLAGAVAASTEPVKLHRLE